MKRFSPEQIVAKSREADRELGKGLGVKEVCRKIEGSEPTCHRWRRQYGGVGPEQIKELKALQRENARLRKIVADQRTDMETLKEAMAIAPRNS